jgi:hypothetical protein
VRSEVSRLKRRDAVYAETLQRYLRDAQRLDDERLGGGDGSFSYDPGVGDAQDAARFREFLRSDSELQAAGEMARGNEAFDNVSSLLEVVPGVGLVDVAGSGARFATRRAAGALKIMGREPESETELLQFIEQVRATLRQMRPEGRPWR